MVGSGCRAAAKVRSFAACTMVCDAGVAHDPGRMTDVPWTLRALRRVSLTEAVSYLVLLGIGMPLKYAFGMPMTVKVTGMLHGVLFLVLTWLLIRAYFEHRWPIGRLLLVFAAAFLPLVPFWLDARVRRWSEAAGDPAG
jgi:integral membrane protein